MGALIDAEADGRAQASALGDDFNGVDDETELSLTVVLSRDMSLL